MKRRLRMVDLIVSLAVLMPATVWGEESLPRDPNNVYGKLENGLSYVIRRHDNPPDRVGLYLNIKTGALNEKATQNGIAHFIEHMSFNGSKHFAPGELLPYLNKLGMEFGNHTNAHTSYDETVYKLFMPDVKEETIDQALTIFADYAHDLLLSQDEIDKERGVILEEARSRKSAGERIRKKMMKSVFEGTRLAVHDVIGDEKQIEKWNKDEFDDYWNTWYRPENMTLIVVGQVDPDEVVETAKKHLGEFKGRGPSRAAGNAEIKPVEKARAFVLTDPEQAMGMVQMMALKEGRPPIRTYADYRSNEVEDIGTWILTRRLQEMITKGTAAFRSGNVYVSSMMHEAILPSGMAVGEPKDWNKMLEQLIIEINRALEHGFAQRELDLAKEEYRAEAERAVEREPTINARVLLGTFSGAVTNDEPILSAPQRLELSKRVLSEVTLEEVQKVFVDNFKTRNYAYVLIMPEEKEGLKLPASADVLAAAAEAWARKTEAAKKEQQAESILAAMPKPGEITEKTTDKDLNITTATLSNGVVVHHRHMDYKKDEVLVHITIPGGEIEETPESHGACTVAGLAFSQPATSRLDSTQIRDLMTGKKVNFGGDIGQDALILTVTGSPKDLEHGLQLAHAILTDAKIEQSAFDNWKEATLQRLEMDKTRWQGQLRRVMDEVVFAGDVRLSDVTAADLERRSADEGQKWLRRIAGDGAMEVAIVGDIALDDAMKLACQYLGSLPKRTPNKERLDGLRKIKRGPGPYARTIRFESVTPTAVVFAGFVSCNERDVADRRLLAMASRILTDRMIERIREKERFVYSIGCQNQAAEAIPGLGMMFAAAPTDPQNAEKLADTIVEMMKEFADKGPTEEEVKTAKKQMANVLDTSMKEPGFWATALQNLRYRGKTLDELKELPDVYQTFTAEQLRDAVRKYLKDDRVIRLAAVPEVKAATTAPAAETAPMNK